MNIKTAFFGIAGLIFVVSTLSGIISAVVAGWLFFFGYTDESIQTIIFSGVLLLTALGLYSIVKFLTYFYEIDF